MLIFPVGHFRNNGGDLFSLVSGANTTLLGDFHKTTGEKIQDTPLESEDDLSYMVGSSRVSEKQLDELKVDVEINTNKNTPPVNWVSKQIQ